MSTSETISALVDTVFTKYDIGTLLQIEPLPSDAIRAAFLRTDHLSPDHLSPDRLSPDHLSPDRLSPDHLSPDHLSPDRLSPDHLSRDHLSPDQPQADLLRAGLLGMDPIRAGLVRSDTLRSGQWSLACGFKLKTSGGTYCLKKHKGMRSQAHAELQSEMLLFAERQDFALTPRVVETVDGNHCLTMANEVFWLCRFIESDRTYTWFAPSWGERECFLAGRGLGALHELLREFSLALCSARSQAWTTLRASSSSELESVLFNLVDEIRALLSLMDADLCASLAFDRENKLGLLSVVESTLAKMKVPALARSAQLVHGDYHPGNLLFLDDRLSGIVDFEYLHLDDVFLDLGYAASMFCLKWSNQADDGIIDQDLWTALLEGYGVDRADTEALMLLECYMIVSLVLQFKWLVESHLRLPFVTRDIVLPAIRHVLAGVRNLFFTERMI